MTEFFSIIEKYDSYKMFHFSEWVQQLDFVKAVLSRLSQSMSVDATQVAFSIFGSYLYDSRDFSSDVNASISYLDSHSRRSGGTDLDAGLDEAIRIMEDSTRSRLNVTSVRKFIFFLTDGNGALSTSTVNKLREVSFTFFKIHEWFLFLASSLYSKMYTLGFLSKKKFRKCVAFNTKACYLIP